MTKQTTLSIALAVLLFACSDLDSSLLYGHWQAIQLIENNDTIDIDLSTTKLFFTDRGHYTYQTSVNYKEAGTYFLDASSLVTKDTINRDAKNKFVAITSLSQDTMKLKMNANGKIQILTLVKTH